MQQISLYALYQRAHNPRLPLPERLAAAEKLLAAFRQIVAKSGCP